MMIQIYALGAFCEKDERESRYIGEMLEWYRREDAKHLKRNALNEMVENLTCLNALDGKIWRSDQKIEMDEKIIPKRIVGKLGKATWKIRDELRDECQN